MNDYPSILGGQITFEKHPKNPEIPVLRLNAGMYSGVAIAFGGVKFSGEEGDVTIDYDLEIIDPAARIGIGKTDISREYFGKILTYLIVIQTTPPNEISSSSWANFTLE